MKFARISDIDPGSPETWRGKVFLSFDIDWAEDFVLLDTLELIERAGVPATWFATHQTALLERIERHPGFELGIHPNFNNLLSVGSAQSAEQVLDAALALAPGCRSVRSHSLTQSTRLLALFADRGLGHECNALIPWDAGIPLRPWRHWDGTTVRVPHCWEDDIACLAGWPLEGDAFYWYDPDGLNVLDFHPIHVYLNTETLERYEASRPVHRDSAALPAMRHGGQGVRTFLEKILVGAR
ncbi:hypothetical protein AZ16_0128 [Bordetella bronchiseptica B18-5 (C3)]|uniref:polysaccharide deacetylase WbmS family protein n=1 Tax=Bordetella bronchiseptica TaxID=518 RepID=UPI0004A0E780|nr:hypothetical protein [Bordetella bronchiseptica]KDB61537.1 hypothetical protein AZ16_0128 [Bordetella bronchiseptica B18-5 (C3)]